MKKYFLVFTFTTLIHLSALNNPENIQVRANRTTEPIVLDAILSESVWKNTPITKFTQRDPDEGKPASQESEVWVAYDNDYIYIAANFMDTDPDSIDRNLMRRDTFLDSDWLGIYLDPYNDDRSGYYFGINAGGSKLDGTMFNDSWDDNAWDGIWESSSKVNSEGWIVEVKIPFSQMRFEEADNMVWGVNFRRDIKRSNEITYFVMVPKKESGFVSKFADLVGLNGIKPKQRVELLPYLVQKAQYLIKENGDPFHDGNQYKTSIGADFKIGLGSSFNLDGTINPDFGQVEVDPAVVNLSAFESYFNEKRPFFIEGQNLFSFGMGGSNSSWGFNFGNPDLFYSRRIGRSPQGELPDYDFADLPRETRILGAAKLTGKIDETWSVGALSAVTERTYATISNQGVKEEIETEPFSHYGVFRTQKEFNEGRQSLGLMLTSVNRDLRDNDLKNNLRNKAYTFGTDGWTFLDDDKKYVINGYFVGSYTSGTKEALIGLQEQSHRYFQRPDATYIKLDSNRTSLSGYYTRIMLNKQEGNFYINSAIGAVSPGFENNDLGFQWLADKINGHLVLGYRWFDPDEIFRRKWLYLAHFRDYDFEGNNTNNGFWFNSYFQFLNYYSVQIRGNFNLEDYSKNFTRGGPLTKNPGEHFLSAWISTDERKDLSFQVYGDYWRNNDNSNSYELEANITWKPNTQILFSIGPEFERRINHHQWVDSFGDEYATRTYNSRYVYGEIDQKTLVANIRLNWTLSPQMSIQLFLQPLMSVGKYSNFNELAEAETYNFNTYKDIGSSINYNEDDKVYTIDPDGIGPANSFSFDDPDFNYKSLRGTLVFRWELLPGSILYLVWSQDRSNDYNPGEFEFGRDLGDLFEAERNDIFLAKFSYWLDL